MADREARVILSYQVDRSSIAQVQRANAQLISELGKTSRQTLTVTQAAEKLNRELAELARGKAVRALSNDFAALAIQTGRERDALERVSEQLALIGASDDEIRQVARAFGDAADEAERMQAASQSAATGGGTRSRVGGQDRDLGALGRAGRELFLLPDVPISGGLSTTEVSRGMIVLDVALQAVGGSVARLLTILGPAGLIIGGVALAVSAVNQRYEEAKRSAEAYAVALEQEQRAREAAQSAIATGQPSAVDVQIAELQAQRDLIESAQVAPRVSRQQQIFEDLRPLAEQEAFSRALQEGRVTAQETLQDAIDRLGETFLDEINSIQIGLLESDPDFLALNEQLAGPTAEIRAFNDQIAELETTARAGAAIIGDLRSPLEQQRRARELEGQSAESLTRQLNAAQADLATLGNTVTNTEEEIAAARAAGNEDLASQLEIFKQQTEQNIERTRTDRDLLRTARDNALAREAEQAAAEDAALAIRARVEAERFAQSATEEQVDDRIAALEAERAVLERANADLADSATDADAALRESNSARIEEIAAALEATEAIREKAQANDAEAEAARAARDAINAQIAAIDRQIALEVQANQLLRRGTVESIDSRLDAINAEQFALSRQMPLLEEMAATSEEGAARFRAAQERMSALNNEMSVLAAIRPDVAQRQYNEEVAKLTESLVRDTKRIEDARDARITQIESDLAERETKAAEDRADALADAERKAGENRVKAFEDFQEEIARIERRFNRDFRTAVAERDALAAFEAKQAREEDLQEQEQQYEKQLATVEKGLRDQQREIERRYDDQLRTARTAANRAIQLERDKATAEINARTTAYNFELQQLRSALFAEYSLQQQFWSASINLARNAVQAISQQQVTAPPLYGPPTPGSAYLSTGEQVNVVYSGGGSGVIRPGGTIPRFAEGGYPTPGQMALVGEKGPELVVFDRPARVFSNADTRRMQSGTGGSAVNIFMQLDGRTIRATSRREAERYFHDLLVAAGVN